METEKILKEIELRAEKEKWPIIGPDKSQVLVETVKKYRPKKILEIGTLVGYSSILMASHMPENGHITTVEIEKESALIAEDNIKKANLSGKITVIVGPAQKIIPKLDGPFDLLFLDAEKDEYYVYLQLAELKLSRKVVVVADNVGAFKEKMKEYLGYVRSSGRYDSHTYDFGFDAVEVSERI